ncbi:hypothetical protein M1N20_00125 [Dehalococcoidia bacterium]|nr:hypothetical protein [Dehalococcoidia bacterium]
MTFKNSSVAEPGSRILDEEMYQQLQSILRLVFGESLEPFSSPIWTALRCPICGKTGMAYVNGGILHVADDHADEYEVVASGLTWCQARTYFGSLTREIFGIGPFLSDEDLERGDDSRLRKRRERFIAMADYLTGVTDKKPSNRRDP